MSDIKDFNQGVRDRGIKMLAAGLDNMISMSVIDTGELFRKARSKVKYNDNEAELIQLEMPRHGFIQMSQGGKGSKATYQNGKRRLTGGTPRPFLRKGVDDNIEELADFVASNYADQLTDDVHIGIKVRN